MALNNLTRQGIEAEAAEISKNILALFDQAEHLRSRLAAELAAGTLDTPPFYGGTPPATTDKANILGAMDDWHAVYQGIQGAVLPQLDYRRYVNFLIGI